MLRPHVADNAVSGWWRTRATRDSFCIVLLGDRDVEWSNQSAQGTCLHHTDPTGTAQARRPSHHSPYRLPTRAWVAVARHPSSQASRRRVVPDANGRTGPSSPLGQERPRAWVAQGSWHSCLLYTSDAADDL